MYIPLPTPGEALGVSLHGLHVSFPSTKHGNDCVFVVVDQFSKMAILAHVRRVSQQKPLTKLFFECVWVHFGLPQTIISYRIVGSLVLLVHPMVSDGHQADQIDFLPPPNKWKTKVVNKMIVHILHMYNSKHPRTWDESLPYVQHSYNRSLHDLYWTQPFSSVLGVPSIAPH
jgi:hypothetical protein